MAIDAPDVERTELAEDRHLGEAVEDLVVAQANLERHER